MTSPGGSRPPAPPRRSSGHPAGGCHGGGDSAAVRSRARRASGSRAEAMRTMASTPPLGCLTEFDVGRVGPGQLPNDGQSESRPSTRPAGPPPEPVEGVATFRFAHAHALVDDVDLDQPARRGVTVSSTDRPGRRCFQGVGQQIVEDLLQVSGDHQAKIGARPARTASRVTPASSASADQASKRSDTTAPTSTWVARAAAPRIGPAATTRRPRGRAGRAPPGRRRRRDPHRAGPR